MSALNQINLIGLLGYDPLVQTISGKKESTVARFSLALNDTYIDKAGDQQQKTTWVTCNCWNGLALVAQKYLKKGSRVHVTGRLRQRSYTDKEGITVNCVELFVYDILLLDKDGQNNTVTTFNQCTLIGLLGDHPQIKELPNKRTVTKFSLALREYKPGTDKETITTWVQVNIWGKEAVEIHQHLKKGNKVLVAGKIEQNTWTDAQNVQWKMLTCTARQVILLDSYAGPVSTLTTQPDDPTPQQLSPIENDLPF